MGIIGHVTNPFGMGTYATSAAVKDAIRRGYSNKVGGVGISAKANEAEAFIYARELVLDAEIRSSKLSAGDQDLVGDFSIDIRSQTATYTHPHTKNKESVNLCATSNRVKQALLTLFMIIDPKFSEKGTLIAPYSKGNLIGEEPLQRKTSTLQNLPREFDERVFNIGVAQALKDQRGIGAKNGMTRRFLFVEKFSQDVLKRLVEKRLEKQKAYASAKNDTEKKAIITDLDHLNRLIENLNKTDSYALTKALSAMPVGPVWETDLFLIADRLVTELRSDLESKKGWLFKGKLDTAEEAYIHDVVGMLFPERGSYFRYCESRGISPKKESVNDVFFRAAVAFGIKQDDYTAEDFKTGILVADFSAGLKQEVDAIFNEHGILATHAIPHIAAPYLNEKNEEITSFDELKKSIKDHRDQVKTDLTLSQLPPPKESSVTSTQMVLTGAAALAGTALAVRSGAVSTEVVGAAARHLYAHPGLILVGTGFGAAGLSKLRSIVAPLSYGEGGYTHRTIQYRKLLLISALGLGTLYGASRYINTEDEWWPDETSWSMGSMFVWMTGLYFKNQVMQATKQLATSAFPQIGRAESAIVKRVEEKLSEENRSRFHMMKGIVGQLLFISVFNRIADSFSMPSFDTVATPVKALGDWAWSFVPDMATFA